MQWLFVSIFSVFFSVVSVFVSSVCVSCICYSLDNVTHQINWRVWIEPQPQRQLNKNQCTNANNYHSSYLLHSGAGRNILTV